MTIDGVNGMAQYNHEIEKYESPTLAINFGTLLKKCCDLAIFNLLQIPNTKDQREELGILKNLIISQRADEVSTQTATNLKENKGDKEELLPLISRLKKLNTFLTGSAAKLKNNNNSNTYYRLKVILYT